MMTRSLRALFFALVLAVTIVPVHAADPELTVADSECDPYPIGRCGAYQRETVMFCYVIAGGRYVSATDDTAIGLVGGEALLGQKTGVPQVDDALLYVRPRPTETFVNDPWNAPFPFQTAYKESNNVPGLQAKDFWCAQWVWFAECEPQQWIGPTGVIAKRADEKII
jgi:hypothetical protein